MTSRRLTLTGLAVAALLAGCGGGGSDAEPAASPSATAGTTAGTASAGATQASRDGDVMFAQMMVPHHEQAVTMADLALKAPAGAQVRALATEIKAAQAPEIATMNGWLTSWGAAGPSDHSGMAMPGMVAETDLTALAATTGKAFDTRWLELMIAHHEGALTMAEEVLGSTRDPQVEALAQAVVTGQTAQIATMKGMLTG